MTNTFLHITIKARLLQYFVVALFMLAPQVRAQVLPTTFKHIEAEEFQINNEGIPMFSMQVDVPDSIVEGNYVPVVEFPELTELTKDERKLINNLGFKAASMPEIFHHYGKRRGKGVVAIEFFPFVKRNGKWMRINSVKAEVKAIKAAPRTAALSASVKDRYAENSVLASGKWVKISVGSAGVYELTAEKLREWGFSNPANVKVFGQGGRIQEEKLDFVSENGTIDDLEEVATFQRGGNLLFWAEGTIRQYYSAANFRTNGILTITHRNNNYSTRSYYFLTEGDNPKRMATISSDGTPSETLTSVTGYALYENDAFGWYAGGSEMYDGYDFATGNSRVFKLSTPDVVTGSKAVVRIAMSASNVHNTTSTSIRMNSNNAWQMSIPAYGEEESAREARSYFQTSALTAENSFAITTTQGHSARLNYIEISYNRLLSAASTPFAFVPHPTAACIALSVASADENTQIWRLGGRNRSIERVSGTLNGTIFSATIDDAKSRYAVVNTARSYPLPEFVSSVSNQNLHGLTAQDLIIMVPSSGKLTAQAQRLAKAHEEEGLRVKIVPAEQIYNEFGSGTPDATAYRRLMKMLYDRAESETDMPKYLLLFGDGAWDNRMLSSDWKNYSPADFLLTYEVSPSSEVSIASIGSMASYVTDDYFSVLDDNEGATLSISDLADIGVGRFPCHDEEKATLLVDKTLEYIKNSKAGAWQNKLVFICDNGKRGENNLHMTSGERVISGINGVSNERFYIKRIYPDAYTYTTSATGNSFPQVSEMIREELKRGALMFNFTGHGNPYGVGTGKLLSPDDMSIDADGRLPIWVFASCEVTPFDSQMDDLGRRAMYNPTGGAVSVVSAARSVYATYNEALNVYFSKYLLDQTQNASGCRLGDAFRLTKASLISGKYYGKAGATDRSINKLKYALLGDPALQLIVPRANIVIDAIDDKELSAGERVQLMAGQKVKFSGHIESNGALASNFRGQVSAQLFDRKETIVCKNNGDFADTPFQYEDYTKKLFEGSDSVRDGKFSFYVTVPRYISYSEDAGRLNLYAVSNDRKESYHGFNDQFYFNGSQSGGESDDKGPSVFLYLNTPDFPDGGYVGTSALLGAIVSDDSGINAVDASIGHNIELILDGDVASPINLNDYFSYDFGSSTKGSIAYMLKSLAPGRHTLSLRVWDLCENSTTATLNFIVSEDVPAAFSIHATENPARTYTTFITTLEADQNGQVITQVFDTAGRMVWENTSTAGSAGYSSVRWDLTDYNKRPLASGIYIYRSIVSDNNGKHKTKSKKMIVVRQ